MTEDLAALCERLSDDLGGFGPARADAIAQTFEDRSAFLDAAREAYDDRRTSELERVPGVGTGYALKLARWIADEEDWEGGDAEPQVIEFRTGGDVLGGEIE